jgi:hypothetical protein
MYANVYTEYEAFLKWYGYEMHCLRGIGLLEKTDAEHNEELINDTRNLAKKIVLG